jgi:hypothetical protein
MEERLMLMSRIFVPFLAFLFLVTPVKAQTTWSSEDVQKALQLELKVLQKKGDGSLRYEDLTLPHKLNGWLFQTWRKPTLLLDNTGSKSRLTLGVYWNGLDDQKWPHWRIFAMLLKQLCGHGGGPGDAKAAKEIIDKGGKDLSKPRFLGGNAGYWRDSLWQGKAGRCAVQVRRTGSRWHTIRMTIAPAG